MISPDLYEKIYDWIKIYETGDTSGNDAVMAAYNILKEVIGDKVDNRYDQERIQTNIEELIPNGFKDKRDANLVFNCYENAFMQGSISYKFEINIKKLRDNLRRQKCTVIKLGSGGHTILPKDRLGDLRKARKSMLEFVG